jgi:putative addiction module component (TIGR02574 family)
MDVATIIKEVGNWPAEERLRLIEEVWETFSAPTGGTILSDAHKQDLQRRLEVYRENPKSGSPWNEVKARLQGSSR